MAASRTQCATYHYYYCIIIIIIIIIYAGDRRLPHEPSVQLGPVKHVDRCLILIFEGERGRGGGSRERGVEGHKSVTVELNIQCVCGCVSVCVGV